jgi:hypothetical protein
MSAIPIPTKKSSEKRSLLLVSGILAAIGLILFVYLMWYVSPVEVVERVQIIAVTAEGCIAETIDGFAVNIGQCNAAPGEHILASVDQSVKQRAAAMNPTN